MFQYTRAVTCCCWQLNAGKFDRFIKFRATRKMWIRQVDRYALERLSEIGIDAIRRDRCTCICDMRAAPLMRKVKLTYDSSKYNTNYEHVGTVESLDLIRR